MIFRLEVVDAGHIDNHKVIIMQVCNRLPK